MYWWHDSGWAWVWMSVMMVAFWSLVAVAVVWVARSLQSPSGDRWSADPPARSPQDILAERYARSEIDSEEYRRRLDDIEQHAQR
jgi:putative membrane protein